MLYNIANLWTRAAMPISRPASRPLPWGTVVFVADLMDPAATGQPVHERRDLERTDRETLQEIMTAIRATVPAAVHVHSPAELIAVAGELDRPLVLSTYGGTSRSRLTLVPAVAESLGLAYVGLDAQGMALAHDKAVTKRLAEECGLRTPRWRLIRRREDIAICARFPLPYVVKPLAEGSSIGIGPCNLIRTPSEGMARAEELLRRFEQPVLVEEFVGGREASLLSIQADGHDHQCVVEVVMDGFPDFFDNNLFDAAEKLDGGRPQSFKRIDADLAEGDRVAIGELLKRIGHYGCIRVDGKLRDGEFHFLELTPDPWLGADGHLGEGFRHSGWTYEDVIRAILQSALQAPRNRAANG